MGDNGALALTPVIIGVAIGASALTLLAFWAWEHRADPRRRWLGAAAVLTGAVLYGVWVWAALVAPRIVAFSASTVVSEAWRGPPVTIAVLAAPGLGPQGPATEELQRLIGRINARDPDLVLVMGDLTAPNLAAAAPEERFAVTLSLSALARLEADLGVVAVLGPLDTLYGRETLSRDIEDAGVALLWNRPVVVERADAPFAIAGWAPGEEADPAAAMDGVPADIPLIVAAAGPQAEGPAGAAALTLVASPRCTGWFGCRKPEGVEGPYLALSGLAGGGLSPPTVYLITLRGENPN